MWPQKSLAPKRQALPSHQALRLLAIAILLVTLLFFTLALSLLALLTLLTLLALSGLNRTLGGLLLLSHVAFFLVFVHALTALIFHLVAVVHCISFEYGLQSNWMEMDSGVLPEMQQQPSNREHPPPRDLRILTDYFGKVCPKLKQDKVNECPPAFPLPERRK
jgi:hypothetical protein